MGRGVRIMIPFKVKNDDTMSYKEVTLDRDFLQAMEQVCMAIKAAGYDPYKQLTGYVLTGNGNYITRSGNARAVAVTLDKQMINRYLKEACQQTK